MALLSIVYQDESYGWCRFTHRRIVSMTSHLRVELSHSLIYSIFQIRLQVFV